MPSILCLGAFRRSCVGTQRQVCVKENLTVCRQGEKFQMWREAFECTDKSLTLYWKTAAVRDITKQMGRCHNCPQLQKSSLVWVRSSPERRMRMIRRRRRQHLLAAFVLLVVTSSFLQSRVTHLQSDRPLRGRRLMHITISVSTHHNCEQVHTSG